MQTTPEKVRAFIGAMPRAKLEVLAYEISAVLALEHDEEHDVPVFVDSKELNSCADAVDVITGACADAGLTIPKIDAWTAPKSVLPDPLTLLHRGLESGIFEDAPQYKADVQALLARENGKR